MRWAGLSIATSDPISELAVSNLLISAGCAGIAIDGEESSKVVTSYLPEDDRLEARLRHISTALAMLPVLGVDGAAESPNIRMVDEQDWANSWKAYFKPLRIGRRIVVTPPWEEPQVSEHDLVIVIDPGMAFGTGTHGTTQLCLTLLEEYVRPGLAVADVGTGSGILSIAAARLGAARIDANDIDPLAVRIAGENAEINGVSVHVSEAFAPNPPYDVVVANILADTVIELADAFATITATRGILIVSGIIEGRENDVRLYTEIAGFTALDTRYSGEWVALVFRRVAD